MPSLVAAPVTWSVLFATSESTMAMGRPSPAENLLAVQNLSSSFLCHLKEARLPWRALKSLAVAINSISSPFQLHSPRVWIAKLKREGKPDLSFQFPALWLPRFGGVGMKEMDEVSIRRDLALQSAVVDSESERRVVPFVNARGQRLFTQSWTPVCQNMKGLVVVLHGLNEHSGRYAQFAKQLNSQGYGVFGMDWIGHGGSDGLHGYVESLDHVVSDVKAYLQRVAADYPGFPCFIFGHSTGGAIALKAALQPGMERVLEGLVLTSPAVRVKPAHPVIGAVAPLFSVLLPRYQFRGANKKLAVCRDPAALIAKYTDPLVYTGPIRIRTGTEILRLSGYLLKNLRSISTPLLVLHGSDDQVTDPLGSQELYNQATSEHKTINVYDGLLHDLLFEPEKEAITEDIVRWLDDRLAQTHGHT